MNLTGYVLPPADEWINLEEIPDWAHHTLGTYLAVVGVAGTTGNSLVLFVFLRYLRLRSQETTFITNMAASDLMCSLLHLMAVYSSYKHQWSFAPIGCKLYAAGVGLCGLVSILTLACISLERCLVIRRGRARWSLPAPLSRRKSRLFCVGIWLYCALLVLPPFFGWSHYIPEGFLTSCSWDYFSRNWRNRVYYVTLFTMGFILPLSVILVAYFCIIKLVSRHEREMASVMRALPECVRGGISCSVSVRMMRMVMILVLIFTTAWLPYSAVTLIGQFGEAGTLTQWVTALPAVFAKTSVVFNPIVYGISHKHFRQAVQRLLGRRSASPCSSTRRFLFLTTSLKSRKHAHHEWSGDSSCSAGSDTRATPLRLASFLRRDPSSRLQTGGSPSSCVSRLSSLRADRSPFSSRRTAHQSAGDSATADQSQTEAASPRNTWVRRSANGHAVTSLAPATNQDCSDENCAAATQDAVV